MNANRLFVLSLLAVGCSHSTTGLKPKPRPDPYEVIYVVDDFLPPIDTMHVAFSLTDSGQGVFDYRQSATLDTSAAHSVYCWAVGDTLGQRLVTLTAGSDTGVALQYRVATFDPAVGVDTTGGVGLDQAHPWVWRWRVGDSTITGFPRPTSWAPGYCIF